MRLSRSKNNTAEPAERLVKSIISAHRPKMLISVAAIACSLLVRPPAVPLYRTPTPARLSSPQMATEELVEQFVDWVRLSKPCSPHVCPGHH